MSGVLKKLTGCRPEVCLCACCPGLLLPNRAGGGAAVWTEACRIFWLAYRFHRHRNTSVQDAGSGRIQIARLVSNGFRSANWILPCGLAKVSFLRVIGRNQQRYRTDCSAAHHWSSVPDWSRCNHRYVFENRRGLLLVASGGISGQQDIHARAWHDKTAHRTPRLPAPEPPAFPAESTR